MDFNNYVFIIARCCNTIQNYLRPQEFGGVLWHLVLILLFMILLRLVAWVGGHIQPCEVVVPGMYGAHYEHDTLISHQFSITNLRLLLCGCIVNWDAMEHT